MGMEFAFMRAELPSKGEEEEEEEGKAQTPHLRRTLFTLLFGKIFSQEIYLPTIEPLGYL